jgi:hypothetical protein
LPAHPHWLQTSTSTFGAAKVRPEIEQILSERISTPLLGLAGVDLMEMNPALRAKFSKWS